MYCVGLTGSIGSGKSTVLANFAARGIDVIDADKIAKSLVAPDQLAFKEIIKHFGSGALNNLNILNRQYLRNLITNNPVERTWLEELLHPLIRQQIVQDIKKCSSPYCVIEIPLLTTLEHYPYLNRVLCVNAPRKLKLARIMKRDACTYEQADAILIATTSDEVKRREICDDVIINDGSKNHLKTIIDAMHTKYLSLATAV